ncbi:hypothetical protein [Priestia megaterium]|jgi:hypothetical protein|uniref:hypothetical protein n=1 Tax=Priestia megaterium TaxID=1404 RepID=UPI000BFA7BB4|nr:hypothetical protein [Priestia megaterium]MBW0934389.1 hypothetical protein [Priestia megaterium]MDC7784043.1 hypothetical protein [Priestia megaterium]PFQ83274.1 hypothetical protein COK11_14830 [Priestia megaterium]
MKTSIFTTKRSIALILSCVLLLSLLLPQASVSAAENDQDSSFELLSADENQSVFTIMEEGQTYKYILSTLNINTKDETIKVDKYLISGNSEPELVESSSVRTQSEGIMMLAAAKCVGTQKVSVSASKISASFNSCNTKKIVNIINDSSGATGAIAGITAAIKNMGSFGTYAGAVAGLLWVQGYIIKKVSDNGKYGIKFITTLPPTVIVPLRNK